MKKYLSFLFLALAFLIIHTPSSSQSYLECDEEDYGNIDYAFTHPADSNLKYTMTACADDLDSLCGDCCFTVEYGWRLIVAPPDPLRFDIAFDYIHIEDSCKTCFRENQEEILEALYIKIIELHAEQGDHTIVESGSWSNNHLVKHAICAREVDNYYVDCGTPHKCCIESYEIFMEYDLDSNKVVTNLSTPFVQYYPGSPPDCDDPPCDLFCGFIPGMEIFEDCECPEDTTGWLDLYIDEDDTSCAAGECMWKYRFEAPSGYSDYYDYYQYSLKVNGEIVSSGMDTLFPRDLVLTDSGCVEADAEIIFTIDFDGWCEFASRVDCEITRSIICGCPCPPSREDWFDIEIHKGEPPCDSTQCKVTHTIDLPTDYESCYTYFTITERDSTEAYPTNMDSLEIVISSYDKCIYGTDFYKAELKLYDGPNDETPCIIKDSVYCNYKEHLFHCDTDCEDVPFKEKDDITFPSPCDPTCLVTVKYESRDGCGNQDIYIKGIEVAKANGDSTACINCPMDTIMKHATFEIIEQNDMDFIPVFFPYDSTYPAQCDTTWRVITSSCWTKWHRSIYIGGAASPPSGLVRVISIYEQCEADCCVRGFEVCKERHSIDSTSTTITDLGLVIGDTCTDVKHWIESDSLGIDSVEVDCIYTCDFFDDVDISIGYKEEPLSDLKISIEEKKIELDPNAMILEHQTYQGQDIFRISTRNAKNIDRIVLTIYDINGNDLDMIESKIAGHQQDFYFDISQYPSGTYVFNIVGDNGQIATGKFVIVK